RGRVLARTILTVPWAVPTVAVALLFTWMYNKGNGVVNRLLEFVGTAGVGWLTDPNVALWSVILTTVWKLFPFSMLVLLAALQSVPKELQEAASTEGAKSRQVFRYVTFPYIFPTLLIVGLFMSIWSFRRF